MGTGLSGSCPVRQSYQLVVPARANPGGPVRIDAATILFPVQLTVVDVTMAFAGLSSGSRWPRRWARERWRRQPPPVARSSALTPGCPDAGRAQQHRDTRERLEVHCWRAIR